MGKVTKSAKQQYEAPKLVTIGTLHELTLQACDKALNGSDGFTFMGQQIHCSSA